MCRTECVSRVGGCGEKHSGQKEHQCKGPEMEINWLDFELEQEGQSEGPVQEAANG